MVKIAVLGCGLMGIKIAGELAYHGHRVKLYDHNLNALNSAHQRIEEDKNALREEGLMVHKNYIGQILCLSRLEETVRDADVIIEAVIDDMKVKQDLFERVSHCCSTDAILCSNSLRLDMTTVFERTIHQERTLGLRFLYPVHCIPEVEITPNRHSSPETISKVRALLERMGKTLFFRSGGEPLILSEEEREARKQACLEQMKYSSGLGHLFKKSIPALSQQGSVSSPREEDLASYSENDHDCAICMDRQRDCLLCPCHHMVTCSECANSLLKRHDGCPICRKDITEIIRVYHS